VLGCRTMRATDNRTFELSDRHQQTDHEHYKSLYQDVSVMRYSIPRMLLYSGKEVLDK